MALLKLSIGAAAVALTIAACAGAQPVVVSNQEFGDRWPFHADAATLHCEGPSAIWAQIGGEYYALNALAPGWLAERYPDFILGDLETVWRDDPNNPERKTDLGPVMDRALAICGG